MATTLESLNELKDWAEYRTFMKERLKTVPKTDCPAFITTKKVDFEIDGKPWKGYAVLAGPKGLVAVKKIRKDGVMWLEGTCTHEGKAFTFTGFDPSRLKGAALTFKKLKLGYSIAGVDPDADDTDGPLDQATLTKRLDALKKSIKNASVLVDDSTKPLLKEAAVRAAEADSFIETDPDRAQDLIREGEEFVIQVGVGALEGGDPTEVEKLQDRRKELVDELKAAAKLNLPENEDVLKRGATVAKAVVDAIGKKDYAEAENRLDELEEILSEVVEGPEPAADADPNLAGFGDWKTYRDWMKVNAKKLDKNGDVFFVSRKKQKFTIDGKELEFFAVLYGLKGRQTMTILKKEGVLFREGIVKTEGNKLKVEGIPAEAYKGARKLFLKLRIGRKLVLGGDLGADEETIAGATEDPTGTRRIDKRIKELAGLLTGLKDACDVLKKAGVSDQPYRNDLREMTEKLHLVKDSDDSVRDKVDQLKKLETLIKERTLDAKVANLDPNDPKTGPIVVKQIKQRFGMKLRLYDEQLDGLDAKGKQKFKRKKQDPKKEAETLKQLYLTLSKAPNFPKSHLKKIDVALKPAASKSEGGWYWNKQIEINTKRPADSMNQGDELGHPDYFPDGVDENCKPSNTDPVSYFDWATLHEVAHGVDDKYNFMDKNGSSSKFGSWKEYGSNVKPIAQVVAGEFGKTLDAQGKKDLEKYAISLMKGGKAKTTPSAEETSVKDWVEAVREGKGLWWKGTETKNRAIAGTVYQEAYADVWVSYDLDARKQGIHGYQFRAPGEWFAELYAAYYSGKLKPSHPFVPELAKLEAPSK